MLVIMNQNFFFTMQIRLMVIQIHAFLRCTICIYLNRNNLKKRSVFLEIYFENF